MTEGTREMFRQVAARAVARATEMAAEVMANGGTEAEAVRVFAAHVAAVQAHMVDTVAAGVAAA
jgi:hypothetical protein